jgi:hypothetical protein
VGVIEGTPTGVRDGGNVAVRVGMGVSVAVGAGLYTETGTPAQETAMKRMNIIAKKRRMDIL